MIGKGARRGRKEGGLYDKPSGAEGKAPICGRTNHSPAGPGPRGCGDSRFSLERERGGGPGPLLGAYASPDCTQLRSSPAPLAAPHPREPCCWWDWPHVKSPNADGAFPAGFPPPPQRLRLNRNVGGSPSLSKGLDPQAPWKGCHCLQLRA